MRPSPVLSVAMWLVPSLLLGCAGGDKSGDSAAVDSPVIKGDPPVNPTLLINEFLASNKASNADTAGEFDDWIELYNTGTDRVSFTGLSLTDDLTKPEKSPLPAGAGIDPGAYYLVWCDNQPEQGEDHATFRIAKSSGVVALYSNAAGYDSLRVDGINYTQQPADLSAARVPDGSTNWLAGQTPTPDAANGTGGASDSGP